MQQNRGTTAVDQARFPLVSNKEISEINKLTNKTAPSINIAQTTSLDICDFFNIPFAQFGACSFSKSRRCMHLRECSTSTSNQFKPSFFLSECGRIHWYAVVHLQHGHKIEYLGTISNFLPFCVFNTNNLRDNLRENPRPEKPRKRRIIINSWSD